MEKRVLEGIVQKAKKLQRQVPGRLQLVKHATLGHGVVSVKPHTGGRDYLKKIAMVFH